MVAHGCSWFMFEIIDDGWRLMMLAGSWFVMVVDGGWCLMVGNFMWETWETIGTPNLPEIPELAEWTTFRKNTWQKRCFFFSSFPPSSFKKQIRWQCSHPSIHLSTHPSIHPPIHPSMASSSLMPRDAGFGPRKSFWYPWAQCCVHRANCKDSDTWQGHWGNSCGGWVENGGFWGQKWRNN